MQVSDKLSGLISMQKTFRKFNGKTFMLDEFSYSGVCKSDAEKRKSMWKKNGLGVRCIKKTNGKYVVYREYHGDPNELDDSSLFPVD
ncbi:hypothetical protein [Methanosarcina barkeri]|nr:hypothetical protein [Methanosarcina barkeri]